ncbi:MAG: hypothetical protein J6D54_12120 [Olsenella sp.]|nr:hypothetical protein [Olsenella sp.]
MDEHVDGPRAQGQDSSGRHAVDAKDADGLVDGGAGVAGEAVPRLRPAQRAGAVFAAGALVAAATTGAPAVPLEVDPKEFRRGEARYQKAEGSTVGVHATAESAAAAVTEAQESLARAAHSILAAEGVLVREASAVGPPRVPVMPGMPVAPEAPESAERTERLIVRAASYVSADGEGVHVPDGQLLWASLDRLAAASADFAMLGGYDAPSDSGAPGEPDTPGEPDAPGGPDVPGEEQWS